MNILNLARTPTITQTPSETVLEAAKIMSDQDAGAVIVTNTAGNVVGIFTERDNLRKITARGLDPRQTVLGDVMSRPVVTASVNTSPQDALTLMFRNKIRHLPIVDAANCLLGVLSLRHALMRRVGEQQVNLETLAAYVTAGGPG